MGRSSGHTEVTAADERGSIVIALLVAMLLSTIAIASLQSTMIETFISDNDYRQQQAFYMAEAGLRHAWAAIQADAGTLDEYFAGNDGQAGTDDDGRLLGTAPISTSIGSYSVTLVDNNDDGDASNDSDGRALLISTGTASGATSTLRLVLTTGDAGGLPVSYLFNNKLTITGESIWSGPGAVIHSNTAVTVYKDATIDGTLQSAGSFWAESGVTLEGSPLKGTDLSTYVSDHRNLDTIEVPEVRPQDFRNQADYIMGSDGKIRDGAGSIVFNASGGAIWKGWKYSADKWELKDSGTSYPATPDATYYVEGNLIMGGHNGTAANLLEMTVITEGYLEVGGHAWLQSHDMDTLAIVGTDAEIAGHTDSFEFMGHILVHEQLKLSGHINVAGGILVEDAEDVDSHLSRIAEGTKFSGHTKFRYDDSMAPMPVGSGTALGVTEWYQEH